MNYAQIAAVVYQACNAYDPYMPPLSPEMAKAWGRQFEKHKLTPDLLLQAVDRIYDEHGSGYRPLPKDITDAGRTIRREEDAKTGPTEEYQALCESKYLSYEESLARLKARTGQRAVGREITS
jgi:hypothetical protein